MTSAPSMPVADHADADRRPVVDSESDGATTLQVTAILVVQDGAATSLPDTLDSLAALHRRPERLILVDATPDRGVRGLLLTDAAEPLRTAYGDVPVITAATGAAFADIIDEAVEALPEPGEQAVVGKRRRSRAKRRTVRPRDRREWFWLLHQDNRPAPDSLAMLTAVVGRSTRVGIAGCKVVAGDGRRLLHVGLDLTRSGRVIHLLGTDETDQGQHDGRRDVLAVSTSGLLIRRDVYTGLGGFDPGFDGDGDGLDLCWRAHLTGHQVIVVPAARMAVAPSGVGREDGHSLRLQRRYRQVALARCSWLALPALWLWSLVGGVLLALGLLLAKQPRAAGRELTRASAGLGLGRIMAARWRFLRRRTVSRRSLRSLFVPAPAAAAAGWASMGGRTGDAVSITGELGGADSEDAEELPHDLTRTSVLGNPALWAGLLATAAAAAWWRHTLSDGTLTGTGWGLTGGQLLPFATDASGVWHAYVDAWQGGGLGHANLPTPVLAVLLPLTWCVQLLPWVAPSSASAVAVGWLLLATVPLSGWSTYLAGRAATRARWPRVAAGLLWAFLPIVTGALSEGRLGPAIAHVVLPLAVVGVLRCGRRTARASTTAATVLAVAVLLAVAPVAALGLLALALVILVVGPGSSRWHAAAVLVLPWLLLGQRSWSALTGDWRMLLAGPGGLADLGQQPPWHVALLQPGTGWPWLGLPVVVLGVVGLARSGAGRAQWGLVLLGLLGLAGALAAPHLALVRTTGGVQGPWAGTPLDLYAAALLGAALLGVRGWSVRDGRLPRTSVRRTLAAGCVVAIGAAVAVAGYQIWREPQRTLTAAQPPVPAFVAAALEGPRAERALILHPGDPATFELVGAEPGAPARDLRRPLAADASTVATVRALLGTEALGSTLTAQLHDQAVGYVIVDDTDPSAAARVSAALKVSGAVTEAGQGTGVWRVLPVTAGSHTVGSSRVVLGTGTTPSTAVGVLDVTGPHARVAAQAPDATDARTVVVSEASGWADAGRVTADGQTLRRVPGPWPTYRLTGTPRSISVDPGMAHPGILLAQGLLLVVVGYVAVPIGGRRRTSGGAGR